MCTPYALQRCDAHAVRRRYRTYDEWTADRNDATHGSALLANQEVLEQPQAQGADDNPPVWFRPPVLFRDDAATERVIGYAEQSNKPISTKIHPFA